MELTYFSQKMQREMKRNDGSIKLLDFYELTLTDGIDTIHGETSEALTSLIDTTNEEVKVRLNPGHLYTVRFNMRTNIANRDGRERRFVGVTIHQMYQMV